MQIFLCLGFMAAWLSVALPVSAALEAGAARSSEPKQGEGYGKLPLSFEANQGQTDPSVAFLSRGSGYHLYLAGTEARLILKRGTGSQGRQSDTAVRMELTGANPEPEISGEELLPGKVNYFIGKDRSKWRSDVPTYARVRYENVYPGIGMVYYGNQQQLEYDFIVAPGADPKQIALAFQGVDRMSVDAQGNLLLQVKGRELQLLKPVLYQERDGIRNTIPGRYLLKGKSGVGFQVGDYDRSRPLIIDPVLVYSGYLGGSGGESGAKIAVDAAGAAYLIGTTDSADFPTTAGSVQPISRGADFFVTKINPAGDRLVYSTYFGGSGADTALGIAVDGAGAAYLSGETNSSDYPVLGGVYQSPPSSGSFRGFITKLNPSGSAIVYSSFLGARARGVAVDASGNGYLTGAAGANLPTTPGAFQPAEVTSDAFVAKINPAGTALVYATYLGGDRQDEGYAIAVDAGGAAYVTGSTHSRNFPIQNPIQPALSRFGCEEGEITFYPCVDAFAAKLNPAGSALVYSTYLGGDRPDLGRGIAVDLSGNAYVTGESSAADFPVSNAMQPNFGGGRCGGSRPIPCNDAFVVKIGGGGDLIYSTFIGGNAHDAGHAIAVDAAGAVYVAGATQSYNFPTEDPIQAHLEAGLCDDFNLVENFYCYDAFVVKIDPSGERFSYATFLGGPGRDFGYGIAVDPSGSAYIAGMTYSNAFPTRHPYQATLKGETDLFIAKISTPPPHARIAAAPTSGPAPLTVRFDGSASSSPSGSIQSYLWEFGDGASGEGPIVTHTYTAPGSYFATLTVADAGGNRWQDQVTVYAGDFVLTVRQSSARINQGSTFPFEFFLSSVGGFNAGVEITCSTPNGAALSCTPASVTPPANQQTRFFLNFRAEPGAPLGRYPVVVTGRSGGISHQVTIDLTVVNEDSFSRPNGTDLGPDWNEYLPDLFLEFSTVWNGDTGNKAAQFKKPIGPDQEIEVQCAMTAANSSCGLMARWSSESNFYRARVDAGLGSIAIYKTVNGVTTRLGEVKRPLNLFALYTLRLVVKGSALSLYFDHEESPLLSVTDSAIKTGEYAGIRGTASAARSIEFKYFSATVPREFNASSADDFNRPNSTNLGANWNELLPNLEIFGNQLRNVDAGSKAAVWNQAIGADQEVAVDCYVTATGNSCGVMGRWSNADNFYRARLDVGAKNITLFKTVNGTTTQLGAAASRPIVYSTYYRIRLLIKGNTLQVFFANETSPAISATDGSLTAGNFAGLRAASSAAATTGFDNFSAAAAGGTPPVNQPPAARISAAPASGTAPLKVHFDGIASSDPDGTILSYLWNFGDGSSASGAVLDHTYTGAGSFTATLTVTDNDGATGAAQVVIKADRPASSILFEDQFNRTTGLGADWKIVSGAYSTDGNFAVSSGATSWAQLMKTLPGSDYAVESVLVVPAGSLYSGVVARGNPSAFSADLYSAQIATNGSVNLYRRNAGSWTLLRSGSAGIAANQAYTLKLKVTGANPVNLEVSLNGSLLFSYSDASASRILSGVPGIENYNSGVKYDRFTVTAP